MPHSTLVEFAIVTYRDKVIKPCLLSKTKQRKESQLGILRQLLSQNQVQLEVNRERLSQTEICWYKGITGENGETRQGKGSVLNFYC